ncbi:MAG: SUMF1/EgtB/PvdO family nonheme iron enzyme [Candidatus Hydrogenedentes bacterium]|nr:SUMF1/EgtB/PvdO family nonheme iron enzyme [Candidatus Hydrogenedentota bacterium]
MSDPKSLIGKRIGNYHVMGVLGKGGMGIVFKARDLSLRREVALKFLPESLSSDEDIVKRFAREARAAARLNHPNIVTIYGVGRFEDTFYIAMEYVEGMALDALIAKKGKVDVRRAVEIARDAAEALAEAHAHGIVHRDIKPQNIMLTKTGRVKVMDFGLARANYENTQLTSSGTSMGTPHYMAPEQWMDSKVDGRADIFSLGVTLYEMISGKAPFNASTPLAIMRKIVDEPTPSLCGVDGEIPSLVSDVAEKMMAKDPDNRYGSAKEVADDLSSFLDSLAKPSAAEAAFSAPGTNLTLERLDKEETQRRGQKRLATGPSVTAEQPANVQPPEDGEPKPARVKTIYWLGGGVVASIALVAVVFMRLGGGGTYAHFFPETDFERIFPGTFEMGSPPTEAGRDADESLHRVSLTRGFWISRYEVTQAQWEGVMGFNPSSILGEDLPVEQVSWEDVQNFIEKINEADGTTYRLPTESEWEYAARAGSSSAYGFNVNTGYLAEYAWYVDNSQRQTHPVGTKRPNAWGLYDMSGNVLEWCQDRVDAYPYGSVVDPKGPETGNLRIGRGGSWYSPEKACRAADRSAAEPANRGPDLGFRLCHD